MKEMRRQKIEDRLRWLRASAFFCGQLLRKTYFRTFAVAPSQLTGDIDRIGGAHGSGSGDWEDGPRLSGRSFLETLDDAVYVRPELNHRLDPVDGVLAAILTGIVARQRVKLVYISMTTGRQEKILSPHAVVDVLGRLHVRAYDHSRNRFADFVLKRVEDVLLANEGGPYQDPAHDAEWALLEGIELQADPSLPVDKRRGVEAEYGIPHGGARTIETRRALRLYVTTALGLNHDYRPGLLIRSIPEQHATALSKR